MGMVSFHAVSHEFIYRPSSKAVLKSRRTLEALRNGSDLSPSRNLYHPSNIFGSILRLYRFLEYQIRAAIDVGRFARDTRLLS